MKKILMILGAVFSVLCVVAIVGFSVLAVKGSALDKESKSYVDEVTPIILANLNKETLFQYASDELLNSASSEDFDKLFNWFQKLGQFKEYNGSEGQATIMVTTQNGKQITGKYETNAEFEYGPATIIISVVKKDDDWQILGFHINSLAFVNN